jgi:Protein of unknown function (DUF2589)
MPIRQVEVLELGELLGSLLRSIVAAQEQSSRATVEFIDAVGLVTTAQDGEEVTALRTVALRYRKRDANGALTDFEVEVPLLSLVNPPALSVAEATLTFAYEVLSTEPAGDTPVALGEPIGPLPIGRPVKLRGVVRSPTSTGGPTEARTSFAVDVNVVVRQEPTPIGVQRLFNLAELGIQERPAPAGEAPAPPTPP